MFSDLTSFLRTMRVYLMGRGLVSLGVIAAAMIGPAIGFSVAAPALVIAVGGTVLTGFMRLYAQRHYEQDMVNLYRDEIAAQTGKAPEEVTRADLKEAAQGNEVIDQALKRQQRKTIIAVATAGLAGMVTFGLLNFGLAQNMVTQFFTEHFGSSVGNILRYASSGIVAGISSLIVHDGLEAAIGFGTGTRKAAAHDRIIEMARSRQRGEEITPEQVYAVLVAIDPTLQQTIKTDFQESYRHMNAKERAHVLEVHGHSNTMQQIAAAINAGQMKPGHLAYFASEFKTLNRPETTDGRIAIAASHAPDMPETSWVKQVGGRPEAQASFTNRLEQQRSEQQLQTSRSGL